MADFFATNTSDNPNTPEFDVITGTAGADRLFATWGPDVGYMETVGFTGSLATGYSGAFIGAAAGNQIRFAGIETFTVTIQGATAAFIQTGDGNDVITGGGGNDYIKSGGGTDVIDGGAGRDAWEADLSTTGQAIVIDLTAPSSSFLGSGSVTGIESFGNLRTGSGADRITGSTALANDFISTGAGDDVITLFGLGGDGVDGGSGNDRLVLNFPASVGSFDTGDFTGSLATGYSGRFDHAGAPATETFTGIEHFTIIWNSTQGASNIRTGDGEDAITGGSGNDVINSGGGFDNLYGGPGDDALTAGVGADWLTGGAGADRYILSAAADSTLAAADVIFDFETRSDRLDFNALGDATRLTTTQLGGSTYVYADVDGNGTQDALVVTFQRAVAGADILTTGTAGVTMFGDAGANTLAGSARADTFIAGDGDDILRGNAGGDLFYGQGGADIYRLAPGDSSLSAIDVSFDFVSGSDKIDVTALTAAGARLTLARFGGSGFLYIDENNDGNADGEFIGYQGLIQGTDLIGAGGLTIYGSGAADASIRGGASVDVIAGFDGADVIIGAGGADQLYGGAGADTFRYEALTDSGATAGTFDFIQDFEVGLDKIDIRALKASAASTFTRSIFNGATFVYVDSDGNGTQDFLVIAAGRTLSDGDILWT